MGPKRERKTVLPIGSSVNMWVCTNENTSPYGRNRARQSLVKYPQIISLRLCVYQLMEAGRHRVGWGGTVTFLYVRVQLVFSIKGSQAWDFGWLRFYIFLSFCSQWVQISMNCKKKKWFGHYPGRYYRSAHTEYTRKNYVKLILSIRGMIGAKKFSRSCTSQITY